MTKSKVRLTSHHSNLALFINPLPNSFIQVNYILYKIEKLKEISFGHLSFAKDVLFLTFPF